MRVGPSRPLISFRRAPPRRRRPDAGARRAPVTPLRRAAPAAGARGPPRAATRLRAARGPPPRRSASRCRDAQPARAPRARRARLRRRDPARPGSSPATCPRASPSPTRRLRDRSPVHVSTRSPSPANPIRVSRLPPMAASRRPVSASPRVMSAARALWPKPNPSLAPAAIASTFLIAPPTSTPAMSSDSYARSASPRNSRATSAASAGSVAATVSAVGSPRATSTAKLGPDAMPTGADQRGAINWWASPTPAGSVGASTKPLDSHTSGARAPASASDRANPGSAATGTAASSRSASRHVGQVGGHPHPRWKRDRGQVPDVFARTADRVGLRAVARPERDAAAHGRARGEVARHGGPPCAGAEDGDRGHGRRVRVRRPAATGRTRPVRRGGGP